MKEMHIIDEAKKSDEISRETIRVRRERGLGQNLKESHCLFFSFFLT